MSLSIKASTSSRNWSINHSHTLYRMQVWSDGYFDINENGHVIAQPSNNKDSRIDIFQLVNELRQEGYALPLLIRFTDILKQRIDDLCNAFDKSILSNRYQSTHTAVYPIKVNQQRKVVEDIIKHGNGRVGLEVGSKPELLAVIALATPGSIIICNGYKDREYIRLALIGQQLGLQVIIVIEKLSEIDLIISTGREMQITPQLGIRIRLSTVTPGKWQNTGGEKSKFGLHSRQIITGIEKLRQAGLDAQIKLVHFHVGSQVSSIQQFKEALNEGTRFYAQLCRQGIDIRFLDIGGGVGIDYEGSKSENFNSINYTLQTYAETVINTVIKICNELELPHPAIITEAGRAMTAHHALLVTNVIDVESAPGLSDMSPPRKNAPLPVSKLWQMLDNLDEKNAIHLFYEAEQVYENARDMFTQGLLDLEGRAQIEEIYFKLCRTVQGYLQAGNEELGGLLHTKLADKFFCNFSLFQSIPDSWAIGQVFPVVPLHRLHEPPQTHATINDLTCDSDGSIGTYVHNDSNNTSLPLHQFSYGDDYLIGIFLVGAYQEILGDMHNLFGDTASVNIGVDKKGNYTITEYHSGDTVADLLDYVNIDVENLGNIYRNKILEFIPVENEREKFLDELLQGLNGYTYLEK